MSRRSKRGRFFSGQKVNEMEYIPAPEKRNTPWSDSIMSWIIWGEEGESGVMAKLGERV